MDNITGTSDSSTLKQEIPNTDTPERNPDKDAWYTAFFIENHLDYETFPEYVCSPEQVRFMVYTENGERYYPCSDRMYHAIMNRNQSAFIQGKYRTVLENILSLIDQQIESSYEKAYLRSLIETKYRHETRDEIMIPSRLEKRLVKIFLKRTHIEDPWADEKHERNRRAEKATQSDPFREAFDHFAPSQWETPPSSLQDVRRQVDFMRFRRLLSLSVDTELWETPAAEHWSTEEYHRRFNRTLTGNGVETLLRFLGLCREEYGEVFPPRKILWLAGESGQIVMDIAMIRFLANMGHKIIIAFKDGPLFTRADFSDLRNDEVMARIFSGVSLIQQKNMGKNALLRTLRSDIHIYALSDGTLESLNLPLTTTTFARVFKEVDGVISRGADHRRRFFDTHFQFTQDIYNICPGDRETVDISFKPRHPAVIKFSHLDLEKKAQTIIEEMKEARRKGMNVMFYSGIIGSIPGRIDMAKKIMSVFIGYLKEHIADTFIINPSDYYEPGMDADDLMYMWEIVQRSGCIDNWRFQTYGDILTAFRIMGQKVPPEWVGKDATYSTGCTKEIRIAQDMQARYPEMQITGPPMEKFMRRHEYGVGKMYDQRLSEI